MEHFSKIFALKLSLLIESGLLKTEDYQSWCDKIIEQEPLPPDWILELTLQRDSSEALKVIRSYAFSEPFAETESPVDATDLLIACYYLCYKQKGMAWTDFLRRAGQESDAYGSKWACEAFYQMLNLCEKNQSALSLEKTQQEHVISAFENEISEMQAFYLSFRSN